jgi:hypothetical protein
MCERCSRTMSFRWSYASDTSMPRRSEVPATSAPPAGSARLPRRGAATPRLADIEVDEAGHSRVRQPPAFAIPPTSSAHDAIAEITCSPPTTQLWVAGGRGISRRAWTSSRATGSPPATPRAALPQPRPQRRRPRLLKQMLCRPHWPGDSGAGGRRSRPDSYPSLRRMSVWPGRRPAGSPSSLLGGCNLYSGAYVAKYRVRGVCTRQASSR